MLQRLLPILFLSCAQYWNFYVRTTPSGALALPLFLRPCKCVANRLAQLLDREGLRQKGESRHRDRTAQLLLGIARHEDDWQVRPFLAGLDRKSTRLNSSH